MRASKESGSRKAKGGKHSEIHISGAEGIYEGPELSAIVNKYIERALTHPRGRPDKITITLEEIKQKPKSVQLLPVTTLKCVSPVDARDIIFKALTEAGISKKAINNAVKVLTSKKTMRGAALISIASGKRLEVDKGRGIRVSRLGIDKSTDKRLSRSLPEFKASMPTVKEALILASKVASCPGVVAEICISDDPDYTTGYVASKAIGYVRIPNIKRSGEMHGGRVFFITEGANVEVLIKYLEKTPVLIGE